MLTYDHPTNLIGCLGIPDPWRWDVRHEGHLVGEQLMSVTGGLVLDRSDLESGKLQFHGPFYNQAELSGDMRIISPVSFH